MSKPMKNIPNVMQRRYFKDNQGGNLSNLGLKQAIRIYYEDRLLEDLLSIFKWEGLPNDIPSYALEMALIYYGKFCMYKNEFSDEYMGVDEEYVCSRYVYNAYDKYRRPTLITTYPIFPNTNETPQQHNIMFDDEFVYCFNNRSMTPTLSLYNFFVDTLSNIELTINMVQKQLRQPYIFEGTKSSEGTINRLMNKIDYGINEYFVVNKDFIADGKLQMHMLDNGNAENKLTALYTLKEKYLQEWWSIVGLQSNVNNKKARLTENESNSYNQIGNLHIEGMLQSRQDFCKRANEKYGLNISCDYSSDIREDNLDIKYLEEGSEEDDNSRNNFEE